MMLSRNGRTKSNAGAVVLALVAVLFTPAPAGAASGSGTTTRVSLASDGSQGTNFSTRPAISDDGRFVAFESLAPNLVTGDSNNRRDVFVRDNQSGILTRVSVSSAGAQGNGHSGGRPRISGNGRYVAFESAATNLVPGDTNSQDDVFVHDRESGTTTRVSVDNNGGQGNLESREPSLSPDGRYVAFSSFSNLVADDSGGIRDVFVRDLVQGTTTRVSESSELPPGPLAQGDGNSSRASISPDGRYVAFESHASNLVVGDTNRTSDVFVHDRVERTTKRVSVASDGSQGTNGLSAGVSGSAAISDDGTIVAFASLATNLVPGDTNAQEDVFVHHVPSRTTTRVSVAGDGTQGDGGSGVPAISGDARYVAFQSLATNLVGDDTNGSIDVFLHDRQAGTTQRVSRSSQRNEANGHSSTGDITADARFVAFHSSASNLVPHDTNGQDDVFVHDTQGTPAQRFVSVGDATVHESDFGTSVAAFTVSLSKPSKAEVTVDYATAEASAGSGDFTAKAGTLTLAPGVTSTVVKVPVTGDTLDEADERFTLALLAATGVAIGDSSGAGTIIDNDPDPGTQQRMSIGDVWVHEGNAGGRAAMFNVSLSRTSNTYVTVSYATAKGSATGTDFTAKSGTLSFAPGVTSLNVKVAVTPDILDEGNESFTLNLSGASGATIADAIGVGTIIDND